MLPYLFRRGETIEESQYVPEEESSRATVFALANGYMGLRGAGEELSPTLEGVKGCYINGIYDTPRGKLTEREFPNVQDWTSMDLEVDGERLDLSQINVGRYRRELNIRRAVVEREIVWITAAGKRVTIRFQRFLSLARPHLGVLRWIIEADRECQVLLRSRIDARVNNRWADHFKEIRPAAEDNCLYVETETFDPGYRIAVMAAHTFERSVLFADEAASPCSSGSGYEPGLFDKPELRLQVLDQMAEAEYRFAVAPADPAVVTKYAAIYDSRFTAGSLRKACRAELDSAVEAGYAAVSREHVDRWKSLWLESEAQVSGAPDDQMALGFSIFHLLAAAPFHYDGVSIPARGLQGQDYYGSIFWDCEIFVLPFFTHTQPDVARRILGYRIATLDGARRKAASLGFDGAYFAWQSQETGDEQCDIYVFTNPLTGEPIRSYFADEQIHISADIAYAAWQYYEATGDTRFWFDGGAEMLCEIARFYVSRAWFNEEKGRYEFLSVLGPDEYHERVNNNAYTNAMAAFSVEIALMVLSLVREHDEEYRRLSARTGLTPDEISRWEDFSRLVYVPEPDPETLLIEQFDGYFGLVDEPVEETRKRLAHPDLHPGGPLGPFQETQNIKQADVIMLLYLFRDRYSTEVKRRNWEYYEKRTAHDSSLSPMAYSLVAADAGMLDKAYAYFMRAATIDLASSGPHWNLGIHAASLGGAWQAVVHGFCGVSCRLDGVRFEKKPVLPAEWKEAGVSLCWHGQRFRLFIDGDLVELTSGADQPIPVLYPGGSQTLEPRAKIRIDFS